MATSIAAGAFVGERRQQRNRPALLSPPHPGLPGCAGFGFVVFQDAEVADKVVATKHTIDRREVRAFSGKGFLARPRRSAYACIKALLQLKQPRIHRRSSLGVPNLAFQPPPAPYPRVPCSPLAPAALPQVEAKKAVPKEESTAAESGSGAGGSTGEGSAAAGLGGKSRKIFVGGLAPSVDEAALRAHFESFGPVEDAVVMYDHDNKRPRGFGFVTFATEDAVDQVFAKGAMQTIADKQIEIKSAVPRDLMPPSNRGGHGYHGFDPRFAQHGGPRGLYGNPYLAAQGLHGQFAGLPLGGRGYGGGPHRGGLIPTAGGPGHHHGGGGRAPGRYDPSAAGLGQFPGGGGGFHQQGPGGMPHATGMHSQGLAGAGGKVPPMGGMQPGYGLYGAGAAALSNGAGGAGGMFAPGSPAALAYNIASLQQAHLNGMGGAGVSAPVGVQQGAGVQAGVPGAAGGSKLGGGAAFSTSAAAANSLSSLKALAMASGLGGAFPGQGAASGAPGSGAAGADDGAGGSSFAVQQQQPSGKDYANAAAAAAELAQVAADYGSYHDPSTFSSTPGPGWSS